MTRVEVHIERLILDGISLEPAGQRALHSSLQVRLAELFSEAGPDDAVAGGAVARVRAAPMTLAAGDDAVTFGSGLADVVYASLLGRSGR